MRRAPRASLSTSVRRTDSIASLQARVEPLENERNLLQGNVHKDANAEREVDLAIIEKLIVVALGLMYPQPVPSAWARRAQHVLQIEPIHHVQHSVVMVQHRASPGSFPRPDLEDDAISPKPRLHQIIEDDV